jgi:hypothetical protein
MKVDYILVCHFSSRDLQGRITKVIYEFDYWHMLCYEEYISMDYDHINMT